VAVAVAKDQVMGKAVAKRTAAKVLPKPDLPALTARAKRYHQAVYRGLGGVVYDAMRCGDVLIKAKSVLKHGEWLPWLGGTGISDRQAQKYMKLAREREQVETGKNEPGAHLPTINEALAELAKRKPTPTEGEHQPQDCEWPFLRNVPRMTQSFPHSHTQRHSACLRLLFPA
jgi:Protein of unknown function (DUF3102)